MKRKRERERDKIRIVLSFYESKLIKIEASKMGNFVRGNVTVGSEPVSHCVGLGSKMLGCYAHPVTKIGCGYFDIKTLLPPFSAKLVLHGRKAKNKTLLYSDPCCHRSCRRKIFLIIPLVVRSMIVYL